MKIHRVLTPPSNTLIRSIYGTYTKTSVGVSLKMEEATLPSNALKPAVPREPTTTRSYEPLFIYLSSTFLLLASPSIILPFNRKIFHKTP